MGCFYLCFCDPGCPPERISLYESRNLLPECLPGTPSQQRWRPCPSWPGTQRLRLPGQAATERSITRRRSRTTPVSCSGRPLWVAEAEHCPDGGSWYWCWALRSRSKPSEEAASWQEATAAGNALRTLSATSTQKRRDGSTTVGKRFRETCGHVKSHHRGKIRRSGWLFACREENALKKCKYQSRLSCYGVFSVKKS